jgi:hypothetical protein
MTYYFLSSSNLRYNFVRNSADCSLKTGMTFSAGSLADLLGSQVQSADSEGPSNAIECYQEQDLGPCLSTPET